MIELNYKIATKKDLFKAKLEGRAINFGLVEEDDYIAFTAKLIELDLFEWLGKREHRAILAELRAKDDFEFTIHDNAAIGWHVSIIRIKDKDYFKFTEMMQTKDYIRDQAFGVGIHSLFVDVPTEQEKRVKVYEKYDFSV